jgi:glucose-1-phosphate thymidylyltransferase
MKVIIPMAGFGTRLRPHTWSKPKPLVIVAGKPLLGHVLDTFTGLPGIEEVIFIVGYLGEQVQAYVEKAYPQLKARYVVQEEMLGQSHAFWLAREGLQGPIVMAFADTLIEADLSALGRPPEEAAVWVKPVADPRRFGVAELGADGRVHRLVEKPQDMANNLAVVGFYYFPRAEDVVAAVERQIGNRVQLAGEFYLADAVNFMLADGLSMRTEEVAVWLDCGRPEALLESNRYLLEHGKDNSAEAARRPAVVIVPPVFIDPTAEVAESIIGPHVTIGPNCLIRRSVIQDSIVEASSQIVDTTLSASLIGRDARVLGRYRSLNVGDSSEVGFA